MSSGLQHALRCLCAANAFAAAVVCAQLPDLPRQMPAMVALPAETYRPPASTIPAESIEPMPDAFADSITPEVIEAPQQASPSQVFYEGGSASPEMPNAFESVETPPLDGESEVYYDGMPDVFPNGFDASGQPSRLGGMRFGNTGDCETCQTCEECFTCQVLPTGIIYHSYLAGPKEPRLGAVAWHDSKLGWQLDYTVGARVGIVRYGTTDNVLPQGFQLDVEGAAFPRVNLDENMDLDAADYRVGVPLTYGKDKWQVKAEVYHLSAHVGDEFLIRNPNFDRINYVRDAIVLGYSCYPVNLLRLYGEVEWAFNRDGGAKPWAFQFGFELSPRRYNGCSGDPFLALNASLREDVDFGGNLCLQTGWQWRGLNNQRLLRTGFHLLTGKSNQFEFMRQNETQLGAGVWYDF